MLVARLICVLLVPAAVALCIVALRRGFSFLRLFLLAGALLAVGRLSIFWVLLFTERTGRGGVSPILQEFMLFPEWMIYGGITGFMGRTLIGTGLVLVGSLAWAALLGLAVRALQGHSRP